MKLQILLNSDLKSDSSSALSSTEVSNLKKQLRNIRDQVNKLLDSIDSTDNKYGGMSHAGMFLYLDLCRLLLFSIDFLLLNASTIHF